MSFCLRGSRVKINSKDLSGKEPCSYCMPLCIIRSLQGRASFANLVLDNFHHEDM